MLLALFLLSTGEGLAVGNALRNVVLGAANLTAAVGFAVFAPVAWSAALPLAIGLFIGGGRRPRAGRPAAERVGAPAISLPGAGPAGPPGWHAHTSRKHSPPSH